ncbi:HK97 gp10 family phage protein [Gilliamella sp. B2894]|uniref:HK97 gp10 family phage protein n=1 Tax=unclassified Gilliamella TaxID=2685620 RepID=UPI00226ACF42|nr:MULTISPECIES: HK97 gp10 family phage protein [unclassified Gilliamella]MCX8657388.1 HK97 gp10 family phage protein [Gilliamella sp. B2894]MCX8693177.1 HK97 gp10 family phage protein [Gilliamella sp. B2881]MCX8696158.1 HK97 gp10 family phage protein [Gilliamella sp. B2828]
MGIKVSGVRDCINRLNTIVGDVQARKSVRAIQSALLIGGTRAALYTPIDTSTLLNSQYREMFINGNRLTGRVGYSANYAAYVHDPNRSMKFKRSTVKKEFLYKGFEDEKATIDQAVRREMKL